MTNLMMKWAADTQTASFVPETTQPYYQHL